MKRTLLEILALGGIVLLFGGMQLDVRSLRSADARKNAEISRLESLVERGKVDVEPRVVARVEDQARELDDLATRLAKLDGKARWIEAQLESRTRFVSRQATEAIARSKALSKRVATTQKRVDETRERVEHRTADLTRMLDEQGRSFEALRRKLHRDAPEMTAEMLAPTVQLSGEETVGSGTLIGSFRNKDGRTWDTYVLTANHVVRNILADDPALARKGITVTIYGPKGPVDHKCDVVIRNPGHDLALVKLRGADRVGIAAKLIDTDGLARLELWTPVYAVGCPLGNDPIPTGGFISSLDNEVRGTKYWMINAPTYYGNSGGGIFDADTRELIAVFSKIYTHGSTRPVVIPHMGLAVPMTLVYPWLEETGYGFLIPRHDQVAAPGK